MTLRIGFDPTQCACAQRGTRHVESAY